MFIRTLIPFCLFVILTGVVNFHCRSINSHEQQNMQGESAPEKEEDDLKEINLATVNYSEYFSQLQQVGIYNNTGRIVTLCVNEADTNMILAGADNGGIWISHNHGNSWLPVDDFAPTLRTTCIAQNHFQHNEFYYSTGVTKKENGITLLDIYRSTNNAVSFSQVTPSGVTFPGAISKIVCSPVDSNTIYFFQRTGVTSVVGLFRTKNKFQTIERVFQPAIGEIMSDFILLDDGSVCVTTYNKMFVSATGDLGSYILQNTGVPSNATALSVTVCRQQPLIRYAGYRYSNASGIVILKSTDGGINWSTLTTLNTYGGVYSTLLAVKSDDPNVVFAGGVGMRGSIDGGANWVSLYCGWDFQGITFNPMRPNSIFFSSDNGVYTLERNQINYAGQDIFGQKHNNTLFVQDMVHGDFSTGNNTIAGMMDIGSYITPTGSASNFILSGDGCYAWWSRQNPNKAYCCPQGARMVRLDNALTSTNYTIILHELDADNISGIDEGTMFIHPFIMNEADDKLLFIPTLKRLWRSVNSGDNWQPISRYYDGTSYYWVSIATGRTADPVVYFANNDSLFVMPSAATATPGTELGMTAPVIAEKMYTDFNNDSVLFMLKKNLPSAIYKSSNMLLGNIQWSILNFPSDLTPISLTTYPGNSNIILVGTREGGIYISTDAGNSWTKERYFPNVQVSEMKFRPSDKKLFVFTYGRGAWSANLNFSVIPLQLLNFSGRAEPGNIAKLTWNTIDESNTIRFEIEGSNQSGSFTKLSFVSANGNGDHTYEKSLPMAEPEMYYRVKAVKNDGTFMYSNTIRLKQKDKTDLQVQYYSSDHSLHITITPSLLNTNAVVYDQAGRRIKFISFRNLSNTTYLDIIVPGIYYLKTEQDSKAFVVY